MAKKKGQGNASLGHYKLGGCRFFVGQHYTVHRVQQGRMVYVIQIV